MIVTFRTSSPEETMALGASLGRAVPPGTVVTLDGDLGSGKTTFVRGVAKGLGIEAGVASPTYTLMQAHEGGRMPLYHFDAWMEGREKALLADGGDEFLGGEGLALIEWGARIAAWLPEPRIAVRLGHVSPEERILEFDVVGDAPDGALATVLAALGAESGGRAAPRAPKGHTNP